MRHYLLVIESSAKTMDLRLVVRLTPVLLILYFQKEPKVSSSWLCDVCSADTWAPVDKNRTIITNSYKRQRNSRSIFKSFDFVERSVSSHVIMFLELSRGSRKEYECRYRFAPTRLHLGCLFILKKDRAVRYLLECIRKYSWSAAPFDSYSSAFACSRHQQSRLVSVRASSHVFVII